VGRFRLKRSVSRNLIRLPHTNGFEQAYSCRFDNPDYPAFSGNDQHLSAPDHSSNRFSTYGGSYPGTSGSTNEDTEFSISVWVKPDLQYNGANIKGTILSKGDVAGSNEEWNLSFWGVGVSNFVFALYNSNPGGKYETYIGNAASFANFVDGGWHHILITCNGETHAYNAGSSSSHSSTGSAVCVYIDGQYTNNASSNSNNYYQLNNSGDPVEFGRWGGHSASDIKYYNGKMDEVSIWDTELTPGQVLEVYNSGSPTDLLSHSAVSDLVNWWRMGDGDSHPTVTDVLSKNHATMNGMSAANFSSDKP